MKAERLDRIYVYVRDLKKAVKFFGELFETDFSEPKELKEVDMRVSMSPLGIALVEPLSPNGVVARTIEKRGEGVAIVAFKVPNLDEAVAEMESQGVRLAQKFSLPGAGKVKGAVYHPKDAFGVMIDLNEYSERHRIISAVLNE